MQELEEIQSKYGDELGVIILEPRRSCKPEPGFLEGVRRIADETGAVLIFDEITSGFKMNLGGIHLTMDVEPDMALFAKALGNGFPIAAVIGRRSVMDVVQKSFISSAFWTERVGFAAALATLKKMEEIDAQQFLIEYGKQINRGWQKLADKYELNISISGIPPLTHITFNYPNSLEIQTYYTQQMLEKGYLLGAAVYTTVAYSDEIIQQFIDASDGVFKDIKKGLDGGTIADQLKDPVKHSGFKRLS